MQDYNNTDLGSGFFATDEWVQFCSETWDIKSQRLVFQEDGKPNPKLECVIYRDKKNRIVNPPVHLYLGIRYSTTPTKDCIKLSRQWQRILYQFAVFLSNEKSVWLAFPPGVIDVRGMRWQNFAAEVRYTYKLELPIDLSACDHAVRKNISKAQRSGYHCTRLEQQHINDIVRVLSNTEQRQNFSNKLNSNALTRALSMIGTDSFRCYGAWSPENKLVSVRVVLFKNGLTALDWIAGTTQESLTSGVTQLLISFALEDLADVGCTDFDFCGATLKHIGRAKESWGGVLTPFYTFRKRDFFYLIETIRFIAPKLIKKKLKSIKASLINIAVKD